MRVEPHAEGSIMHVVKRGARGGLIVRDTADRKHFLKCLRYLNDEYTDENWSRSVAHVPHLTRPEYWPPQKPLVSVLAWTLMPNHFHLILREEQKNGIAKFMQRVGGSMSMRANIRYEESGSLFQGSYKGRVVRDDHDLRWLASYVMAKNTLELYSGGLINAVKHFERAWKWGVEYTFSSMGIYGGEVVSPIVATNNILFDIFDSPKKFKADSQDMLKGFVERKTVEMPQAGLE
jgi:putative transposase